MDPPSSIVQFLHPKFAFFFLSQIFHPFELHKYFAIEFRRDHHRVEVKIAKFKNK